MAVAVAASTEGSIITGGVETPPSPLFIAGELIAGTYLVRAVLGSGGMGQVYAADDLELQRSVAIKTTIRNEHDLLRREARALAQIHHPNLVAVHGFGAHRGIPFMVMERLYGTALCDYIAAWAKRRRPVDLDEALVVLSGIAEGLTALHAAGIAHLDLKPSNVVLCAGSRVVLIDLGIMVPEVVAGDREPCGTPLYMAPELVDRALVPGRACRADVYSFGALAHEVLVGTPPFVGPDLTTVLARHLVEDPPDVCAMRSDIPVKVGALVRACMAKCPDDRPSGAEEIAWELRGIIARRTRNTHRLR